MEIKTTRKPADNRPAEPPSPVTDLADAVSRAGEDKPTTRRQQAAPPTSDVDGLASQLAAIEAEKRALLQKENQIRKAMWDDGISRIKAVIQQLITGGHESGQIAKALGFHNRPAAAIGPKGPTSNAGWFQTFRSRAIQVYLKAHPDLAASLKSQAIASSDYPTHIPTDDLRSIDAQAQMKADAKCPKTPSVA